MADLLQQLLDSFAAYVYGPWGEPQSGECGCAWQGDPQGHRQFVVWNWLCTTHARITTTKETAP